MQSLHHTPCQQHTYPPRCGLRVGCTTPVLYVTHPGRCRNEVAVKYKKKIELMVRKPDKAEEPEEVYSDCPFCAQPGPDTETQCATCQNIIPFDIATGKLDALTTFRWQQLYWQVQRLLSICPHACCFQALVCDSEKSSRWGTPSYLLLSVLHQEHAGTASRPFCRQR
jgi:hypothetical protein